MGKKSSNKWQAVFEKSSQEFVSTSQIGISESALELLDGIFQSISEGADATSIKLRLKALISSQSGIEKKNLQPLFLEAQKTAAQTKMERIKQPQKASWSSDEKIMLGVFIMLLSYVASSIQDSENPIIVGLLLNFCLLYIRSEQVSQPLPAPRIHSVKLSDQLNKICYDIELPLSEDVVKVTTARWVDCAFPIKGRDKAAVAILFNVLQEHGFFGKMYANLIRVYSLDLVPQDKLNVIRSAIRHQLDIYSSALILKQAASRFFEEFAVTCETKVVCVPGQSTVSVIIGKQSSQNDDEKSIDIDSSAILAYFPEEIKQHMQVIDGEVVIAVNNENYKLFGQIQSYVDIWMKSAAGKRDALIDLVRSQSHEEDFVAAVCESSPEHPVAVRRLSTDEDSGFSTGGSLAPTPTAPEPVYLHRPGVELMPPVKEGYVYQPYVRPTINMPEAIWCNPHDADEILPYFKDVPGTLVFLEDDNAEGGKKRSVYGYLPRATKNKSGDLEDNFCSALNNGMNGTHKIAVVKEYGLYVMKINDAPRILAQQYWDINLGGDVLRLAVFDNYCPDFHDHKDMKKYWTGNPPAVLTVGTMDQMKYESWVEKREMTQPAERSLSEQPLRPSASLS